MAVTPMAALLIVSIDAQSWTTLLSTVLVAMPTTWRAPVAPPARAPPPGDNHRLIWLRLMLRSLYHLRDNIASLVNL